MTEQRVTEDKSGPPGLTVAVNAVSTPTLSEKIQAKPAVALPVSTILRWGAIGAVFRALWKSARVTLTPYERVQPPNFGMADFPMQISDAVHAVFAAALGQEEQRSSRLDTKAGAFLSAAGVLIPLVITVMSGSAFSVQILFLVAIVFSAVAGLASFRALQMQHGHRLSEKAAIDGDAINGKQLRTDASQRHALTLLYTLKVEEAINDHRVTFIDASSRLLVASTLALCAAAVLLVGEAGMHAFAEEKTKPELPGIAEPSAISPSAGTLDGGEPTSPGASLTPADVLHESVTPDASTLTVPPAMDVADTGPQMDANSLPPPPARKQKASRQKPNVNR